MASTGLAGAQEVPVLEIDLLDVGIVRLQCVVKRYR